jgi:hypothetical protein
MHLPAMPPKDSGTGRGARSYSIEASGVVDLEHALSQKQLTCRPWVAAKASSLCASGGYGGSGGAAAAAYEVGFVCCTAATHHGTVADSDPLAIIAA